MRISLEEQGGRTGDACPGEGLQVGLGMCFEIDRAVFSVGMEIIPVLETVPSVPVIGRSPFLLPFLT